MRKDKDRQVVEAQLLGELNASNPTNDTQQLRAVHSMRAWINANDT
eukprot:COSAG01_NODE_58059_length_308_cov_0.995215_1_plen_46_part_00